ncbi:MAG: efflux RND transporter periplasmic adaptor subunit [Deltaproteobacteria bacterium]|nr:MAG: efflux RND transporter periplasmic adaptor subunit [Deltaproteobacteria bacterium]TMB34947.1 MAG: efflux RND transporter periplasmic adaptor subunit [Deltaproteobacteria bacterium]
MTARHDTTGSEPHLGFVLPEAKPIPKKRLVIAAVILFVVLVIAFAYGYLPRRGKRAALEAAAESSQRALVRVEVISPKLGASDRALELPGTIQPLQVTMLFARASGFVRAFHADIGDRVKTGQLLAEIETPELDQELSQARAQLMQARASLAQAKANRKLAEANLGRARSLEPSGVVSRAELEQNEAQAQVGDANVSVADANVAAQQANIRRLEQLKAFSRVTAPFAGTITQRIVEVGALVTGGNAQPLFRLAALDPVRVFVQVPQDVAPSVRSGVSGNVTVREYPGKTFKGEVMRSAGALDEATRTMNTEIRVPNGDGALLPGMYAEVALTLPASHRVLELPATALMNDARGQHVGVVDGQRKLHLVPVVIERDNGATVDISSGLTGDEKVVKIGSAAFVEGMSVEVASPQADRH